MNFEKKIRTTL